MKKLSLFSLLGLTGLLAFVATPIYAQEDEVVAEDVVVEAENVVDEAVDVVDEAIDETADVVDETIDDAINFDGMEDFNSLFENEEVQNALAEAGLTSEEGAGLIGAIAGFGIGLLITFGIIGLIFRILHIIALWKAFERAGEGGWKALIPVYCSYIKYKLAGMKNWFWYSLGIVLIIGIIAACLPDQKESLTNIATFIAGIIYIVVKFKFAKNYGWGTFASILFVLFYPICILVLGFGNYPYQGKTETVVEA